MKIQKKLYEGVWKFEVNVPEEFYTRENVIYKVKKCNDSNTKLTKAVLSKTGLKIALTTSTDKINYDDFYKNGNKEILKNVYVETSGGKKYGASGRSDGDGGFTLLENNVIEYTQTFNLTTYDATDILKINLITNKEERIIIELEK